MFPEDIFIITFTKNEILPTIDITKNFGGKLDKLKKNKLEKIAVLRDNQIEAVIIPIKEYEYLKQAYDYYEHFEIYNTVKDRLKDPPETWIPFDVILKKFGINKDNL